MKPRALIITGDGLNCEEETARAFELAGAEPRLVHITDLLDRVETLDGFQILAFIGGFSNGDHLGAGTVQASRFRHALREDLSRFVEAGKPVIGICNGFQTLVKMGILPGPAGGGTGAVPAAELPETRGAAIAARFVRTATIMENDSGRFEDRWVHLKVNPASPCVWTRGLETLFLPVRHGEGKFVADRLQMARLKAGGQVALQYSDPAGRRATMDYPANPNGSAEAIAGVSDATGAILGLMPHPEAYLYPFNHPAWTREAALGRPLAAEGEGVALFRNGVRFARDGQG